MPSKTVRIGSQSQALLRELAKKTGRTMQTVLEEAIEAYRREQLLKSANQAFAALRRDARKWKQELGERAAWDTTSSDDLAGD